MQLPDLPEEVGKLRLLAESAFSPATRIQVTGQMELPPETSKFGGLPFTPEEFKWPVNPAGRLMEFIGQINFAEVVSQAPSFSEVLPSHGIFQFFYDLEELVWGFDPNHQNFWRFIWHPSPHSLRSIPCREGGSSSQRVHAISFQEKVTLPDIWTLLPTLESRSVYTDEEIDAYQDFIGQEDIKHQLLGHSWNIQDDPRYEAQLVSNGVYCGDPSFKDDPRTPALLERVNDWQLLWQIDSDDSLDVMWGDCGMLYIMVKREALRAGDLSAPWLGLQCF
ncbi:MAG TPA: YwqG family protein [Blastocatellia bacterium]|jgi:uncharacterized protein YwqG